MTRGEISKFLSDRAADTKESVVSAFSVMCVTQGVPIEKVGKLIADLRSYPEWKWGT